ncbi:PREDICTED: uncharacterized protein LOC101303656 [Fragaria vesca subsp. vesca]
MSSTDTKSITQIYIFALKTGSWRCYEESWRIESKEFGKMGGQGCLSNGALHWIELVFDSRRCLDGSRSRIVAFVLAEEQFREMASLSSFIDKEYLDKIPASGSFPSKFYIGIGITNENGLIVYSYKRRYRYTGYIPRYANDSTLTVWVMKEYGIEKSWTKFIHIPMKFLVPRGYDEYLVREYRYTEIDMSDYLFPVHILEDGKVLMSCDDKKLVLYNPEEKAKRTVLETSLSSYAVVYVETLISPRPGRGADISRKERKKEEA